MTAGRGVAKGVLWVLLVALAQTRRAGASGRGWRVGDDSSSPGTFFPSQWDLLRPAAGGDGDGAAAPPPVVAVFSLDAEEGVAYLQVERTDGGDDGTGWVEVYQEGHRLMTNFSGSEISLLVAGVDTYVWASVFDGAGRWVGQSNVLHTGNYAGVSVELDPSVGHRAWVDGEALSFDFTLRLRPGVEQQVLARVIVLIDNQTVGMIPLDVSLESDEPTRVLHYQHHGEVEVGRHTLHLALLEAGHAFPTVLSEQLWFTQTERPIPAASLTASLHALNAGPTAGAGGENSASSYGGPHRLETGAGGEGGCGEGRGRAALRECVVRREAAVPPNRQYSEVRDALAYVCVCRCMQ
jgi:hypothetical protein